MDSVYSVRQLYNMLEQLDVYDALKHAANSRVRSNANKG